MSAFNSPAHALSWLRKQGLVVGGAVELVDGREHKKRIDLNALDRANVSDDRLSLMLVAKDMLLRDGWTIRRAARTYSAEGQRNVWCVDRLGVPTERQDR